MDDPRMEPRQADIRRLLKTFGVKADEAIQAYLECNPDKPLVQVRCILETVPEADQGASLTLFTTTGEIHR